MRVQAWELREHRLAPCPCIRQDGHTVRVQSTTDGESRFIVECGACFMAEVGDTFAIAARRWNRLVRRREYEIDARADEVVRRAQ